MVLKIMIAMGKTQAYLLRTKGASGVSIFCPGIHDKRNGGYDPTPINLIPMFPCFSPHFSTRSPQVEDLSL